MFFNPLLTFYFKMFILTEAGIGNLTLNMISQLSRVILHNPHRNEDHALIYYGIIYASPLLC